MRKVNLLRCDVARDASMQDLFSELRDTRGGLSPAPGAAVRRTDSGAGRKDARGGEFRRL